MNINPIKYMDHVFQASGAPGVQLVTVNLNPGLSVYGERLFSIDGVEYREWMHNKSKLASGMLQGMRVPALHEGATVLYLGASSGTTVSHVSDIVGKEGIIFAVEFAARPMRDLLALTMERENIIPILGDARFPSEYTHLVHGVDLVYADVAQPNQAEILVKNAKAFLKKDGLAYIAVKTRSISQLRNSKAIFDDEAKQLEDAGFTTIKTVDISRYHREHFAYLGKWKP